MANRKTIDAEAARRERAIDRRAGNRLVLRHSAKSEKLMAAIEYLQNTTKEELTLCEIAGRVGLGYSTLRRWLSGNVPKSLQVDGESLDEIFEVPFEFMRNPGRPRKRRGRPRNR